MRLRMLLVAAVLALTSCSADDGEVADVEPGEQATATASETARTVDPLPTGKDVLEIAAGSYRSPEGFVPALELDIPAGWTSVHRAADAFDLGRPDPERDAPLVAVVLMTPAERDASGAIAAVRARATGQVRAVPGGLGPIDAQGLDVTGGRGELVASADGGIALDAAPGQRVRLLAADIAGTPLVVAVLVPDGSRWSEVWPDVRALLDGVRPA